MGCGVTEFMQTNNVQMREGVLEDVSTNYVGAGLHVKEIPLKADQCVIKHKHHYDHLSILMSGTVVLETDEYTRILEAPTSVVIKANLYHKLTAMTDALWLCVHADNA
jgi:quercetin dioxygenase-like cupin family protein